MARGLFISGIFIFLLPVVIGSDSIWFAMPITELLVAIYVVYEMIKYTKQLKTERRNAV